MIAVEAGEGGPKRAQTALDQRQARRCDRARRGAVRLHLHALARRRPRHSTRQRDPTKRFLSFKNQGAGTGGEGLLVTSKEDVTVAELAIEDARGDGIKTNGTKRIVFRNVRTEWTGGPKETNGGLRNLSRALHGRVDRGLQGRRCLRCRHLRRPVDQRHRPAELRSRKTSPASRSKTAPRPMFTKTRRPTTPAGSWFSRCPTCRPRMGAFAASSITRSWPTTMKTSRPRATSWRRSRRVPA